MPKVQFLEDKDVRTQSNRWIAYKKGMKEKIGGELADQGVSEGWCKILDDERTKGKSSGVKSDAGS